jgi:hypothetical protein
MKLPGSPGQQREGHTVSARDETTRLAGTTARAVVVRDETIRLAGTKARGPDYSSVMGKKEMMG